MYENHSTYDVELLMADSDAETNVFLTRSRTGRGFVTVGVELGDSVQVSPTRWLSGKGFAEVRLPCHLTTDDYETAGKFASSFARGLAMAELENIQNLVQYEIGKLPE